MAGAAIAALPALAVGQQMGIPAAPGGYNVPSVSVPPAVGGK